MITPKKNNCQNAGANVTSDYYASRPNSSAPSPRPSPLFWCRKAMTELVYESIFAKVLGLL